MVDRRKRTFSLLILFPVNTEYTVETPLKMVIEYFNGL